MKCSSLSALRENQKPATRKKTKAAKSLTPEIEEAKIVCVLVNAVSVVNNESTN